jgi:hypothetical protein
LGHYQYQYKKLRAECSSQKLIASFANATIVAIDSENEDSGDVFIVES